MSPKLCVCLPHSNTRSSGESVWVGTVKDRERGLLLQQHLQRLGAEERLLGLGSDWGWDGACYTWGRVLYPSWLVSSGGEDWSFLRDRHPAWLQVRSSLEPLYVIFCSRFAKWLSKNRKLQGIPPSPFFSQANKSVCQNYIRFCFIKPDEKLRAAKEILTKWRQELDGTQWATWHGLE